MNFRFSAEDDAFRSEVRGFIKQEWLDDPDNHPADGSILEESYPQVKALRKKLAARNWIAIAWPVKYGGAGATLAQQAIFKEEMIYWRCPGIDYQAYQLGPAIMVHGTEEQKKQYLGGHCPVRDSVLPGLLRTQRRLEPGRPGDPCRCGWR